jgi:hypothetical protein
MTANARRASNPEPPGECTTLVWFEPYDEARIRMALSAGIEHPACPACGATLGTEIPATPGPGENLGALRCEPCRRCVVIRRSELPPARRRRPRG